MLHRPYGNNGRTISSIAVQLDDARGDVSYETWRARVRTAILQGVTAFEVVTASKALAEALGVEVAPFDQAGFVVSWRLRAAGRSAITGLDIADAVDQALDWTGLSSLDILMLEGDVYKALEPTAWDVLESLARTGGFERLGIVGGESAADLCLSDRRFTALKTFYGIGDNQVLRRKIIEASRLDTIVLARAYFGSLAEADAPRSLLSEIKDLLGFGASTLHDHATALDFLKTTPGWTAEDLNLACLLTDPVITAAVIETIDAEAIARLSRSIERELPKSIFAHLEIARTAGALLDSRKSGRKQVR
ncbi:MAG: hypothetical protein CGW95_02585 [Phenylobacterium zucineum]|nr:MAG: hypothetical protein CGW95_02585 [Phenylobacterium zucineum]